MYPLLAEALDGNARALGKLVSMVEDDHPDLAQVMRDVAGREPRAHIIGLTGSPGVGKSTTTSALVSHLRQQGKRVAVLAVDPSSPYTGGALLGDRIRMQEHALDADVFIRSMASRGKLGGLAGATHSCVRLLSVCNFDVVILETVGVGQSEVDIVRAADTTVVISAPGLGDGIQASKAGILEIADIYVVNKADREGADTAVRELSAMLSLNTHTTGWEIPVVQTVATSGQGVDELAKVIAQHLAWATVSGELQKRREQRAHVELTSIITDCFAQKLAHVDLDALAEAVASGKQTAFDASAQVLKDLGLL